ncbi:unnamed protein product [Closterium sp. Yama58-4]|nr:unnamed protein product [Closterium sp. Yama58-4]
MAGHGPHSLRLPRSRAPLDARWYVRARRAVAVMIAFVARVIGFDAGCNVVPQLMESLEKLAERVAAMGMKCEETRLHGLAFYFNELRHPASQFPAFRLQPGEQESLMCYMKEQVERVEELRQCMERINTVRSSIKKMQGLVSQSSASSNLLAELESVSEDYELDNNEPSQCVPPSHTCMHVSPLLAAHATFTCSHAHMLTCSHALPCLHLPHSFASSNLLAELDSVSEDYELDDNDPPPVHPPLMHASLSHPLAATSLSVSHATPCHSMPHIPSHVWSHAGQPHPCTNNSIAPHLFPLSPRPSSSSKASSNTRSSGSGSGSSSSSSGNMSLLREMSDSFDDAVLGQLGMARTNLPCDIPGGEEIFRLMTRLTELQARTLWAVELDHVVRILVLTVFMIRDRVLSVFGIDAHSEESVSENETLGSAGLALRYARIILLAEKLMKYPFMAAGGTRYRLSSLLCSLLAGCGACKASVWGMVSWVWRYAVRTSSYSRRSSSSTLLWPLAAPGNTSPPSLMRHGLEPRTALCIILLAEKLMKYPFMAAGGIRAWLALRYARINLLAEKLIKYPFIAAGGIRYLLALPPLSATPPSLSLPP